jgi:uncharacterized protein YtpQ (UPF0354 family)
MKRFFQSIFSGSGGDEIPLTPAQFTRAFVEALHVASPDLKIEIIKDLEVKMQKPNGKDHTVFLYNTYDSYKADPKSKETVMQRFVSSLIENIGNEKAFESLDPTRIIPVIKDRPWLEETRQALISRGAKKVPENVYEDFNEDLIILYAEDSPKNIRYFNPEDLEKARIDRKDLRNLACENLKRLLPNIEQHGANGLYMLAAGGDYEASLLLFDSIWSGLKGIVRGDVVVAIPTRDVLVVTGSEDAEGILRMKNIIEDALAKGAYRLTKKMFVYRGDKFEEFRGT